MIVTTKYTPTGRTDKMARPEVLEKIQDIEIEVEKIIVDAEKMAQGSISKAEKKAESIVVKENGKTAKNNDDKLERARVEIEVECKKILKEVDKDIKKLEKDAAKNHDGVILFIKDRFKESVDAKT